ncbi:MAG: thermonuclease family protein [Yoonia sp.]|nr:thermonuclease family protein [Yoonia sp.]
MDARSFAYAVLLFVGLVGVANWLSAHESLTADGCTLNYVYDGDTVALDCADGRKTARLVGFDTPETKNFGCAAEKALGDEATLRLRALAASGELTFDGNGEDKYGRVLAVMKIGGIDVSNTLIDEGLAVPYAGGKRINWCRKLG